MANHYDITDIVEVKKREKRKKIIIRIVILAVIAIVAATAYFTKDLWLPKLRGIGTYPPSFPGQLSVGAQAMMGFSEAPESWGTSQRDSPMS